MPEKRNKDAAYKAAKPKEKDYSINDGGGLSLLIKYSGVKRWLYIYRFNGKQNRLGLGVYPDTTLENARRKTEEYRKQIANGIDPGQVKKQLKSEKQLDRLNSDRLSEGLPILNSFADVAKQWLDSIAHLTKETTHIKKSSRLERLAYPIIGSMLINQIKSSDVLAALKPLIDKSQLETAHRLHSEISAIFAYAIVHNLTDYDPAQPVTIDPAP